MISMDNSDGKLFFSFRRNVITAVNTENHFILMKSQWIY